MQIGATAHQEGTVRFAVNPSLTAIANALRVGDHLTERLGNLAGRGAA